MYSIDRFQNAYVGTEASLQIKISAQSCKHFTLINYDSRAVITSKLLIRITLES